MVVDYNENEHLNALFLVLDDHVSWFNALMQCLFYPDNSETAGKADKPVSFDQWLIKANQDDAMTPEIIESLTALHSDLFKASDMLVNTIKESGKKPDINDFQKFLTVYEEFLLYVRRLEKDIFIEGSGYDAFTGLRSKTLLHSDLERELQRLARQGKSFCVAMIKVDDFDLIQKNLGRDESNGYLKLIASLIKLSIRSFDDAYYIGEGEFVLSLKQADVSGGISALERLRRELERQNILLRISDGKETVLSMSCCIAEPVAGDDTYDLIKHLHEDLSGLDGGKSGSVLEYHELSPLQRYVQENRS